MTQTLKPYPTYRTSVKKWLGNVPAHWETRRIKTLFRENDIRSGDGKGTLLSLTRKRGIIPQTEASNKVASVDDLSKYKICLPNDLVMNRMQAWSGMFAVSSINGLISPDYSLFQPVNNVDIKYFEYLFKTPILVNQFAQNSKGIGSGFNRLYTPDFGAISVSVPPLSEQATIVRYLNYMDSRINRYIKAKKKLIELLNEQKQAIIHKAVTRGLDPNVRLKPSGIEWLGDIPEHWERRRLRNIIKGRLTYGANIAAEYFNTDWPRYLRITDFGKDGIIKTNTFRSLPPDIAKDHLVESGDILFARSGATVGKAFLVTTEAGTACHAGYLIRARPNQSLVIPEFLFAYTQSYAFQAWRDSIFIISTIQNISAEKYATLPIPIPSITEQKRILDLIKLQIQPIDIAISSAKREIDFLYEYRSRLVADVVTGKLDVRDIAASLPDEIEETADNTEIEIPDDSDLEKENISASETDEE
jgi:type I restriction enzyme S subunit